MTVSALLKNRTLPLMGERVEMAAEYEEFCLGIINLLLVDTYRVNEDLRFEKGLAPLKTAPVLTDMEEEIPYEEELVGGALAYGLGARLTLDEGDVNKTGFLEHGYVERLGELTRARYTTLGGENA